MEPGPLPPHERPWRHPSEVAAEERAVAAAERSPRSTRVLAFMTGTVGLLAVGMVMVTVTPQGNEAPVAVSASTTPSVGAGASTSATGVVAFRSDDTGEPAVLATPIGDGSFAVVTRASLMSAGNSARIEVTLPSGREEMGSIVTGSDDAVLVALDGAESGHPVADHRPRSDEIVTVLADPPVTVPYRQVPSLTVDEGTAVIDEDGHLVGLCSRHGSAKGVRLIELTDQIGDATSVVP